MKKRILSLAVVMIFSIVSILGCFNAFAAGNPSITPPSNYAVKTALIADDFEDRTVDGTIADGSSYSAPVTAELSIGVVLSFNSCPYSGKPASRRRVSLAPNPTGTTPNSSLYDKILFQRVTAYLFSKTISKPSSPV